VLSAFAAAGKWPLLSIRQDGTINEPLRRFQASVNPLLKQRGGFRFMEALCQQYTMPCTLDGTSSNASACCVSQVEELIQQVTKRNTVPFSTVYHRCILKTIVLARQARDEHTPG
jgi:hypothetical protein